MPPTRAAPLGRVPSLRVTLHELRELPLDPRAGFVVSLIDGLCTVETIADVAGFDATEVVAIVLRLLRLGAIELRDPRTRRG